MNPPTTTDMPRSSTRLPNAYISPTLSGLESTFRPKPSPACETCPASLWFATKPALKCYCTRMHAIVWDLGNEDVMPILECDGRELALQALLDAASN